MFAQKQASAVGDENEEAGQAAANNNTQGKTCSEFADGRARTSCLVCVFENYRPTPLLAKKKI